MRCDVLRTGDVIITDTAEDDTVGKAIEVLSPPDYYLRFVLALNSHISDDEFGGDAI